MAPSTVAASCSSSGTSASPASSSSAMNGVVFQTSARIDHEERAGTGASVERVGVSGRAALGDEAAVAGSNANRQANAATTVTMPYGISDGGADQPAAEDRPVHDQRDQHAEHELDRHRDDRDEHACCQTSSTTVDELSTST